MRWLGRPPGPGVQWGLWPHLRSPDSTAWLWDHRMRTPAVHWPEGGTWWSKSFPYGLWRVTAAVNQLSLGCDSRELFPSHAWKTLHWCHAGCWREVQSYPARWAQAQSASLSARRLAPATPGSLHRRQLERRDPHVKSHVRLQLLTDAQCRDSLTHSKPLCVKRVPGEVDHIYRILDGGQGCVWQSARLRALRGGEENTHCRLCSQPTKGKNSFWCNFLLVPRRQQSGRRRWQGALPRAGSWHRSHRTPLGWSGWGHAGSWCVCPGASPHPGCDGTWRLGLD